MIPRGRIHGKNFNPHSPCGERLFVYGGFHCWVTISIHTPLAGSDRNSTGGSVRCTHFNPHSPCGERLAMSPSGLPNLSVQPTLPLRGATAVVEFCVPLPVFQSTLPLRGATVAVERQAVAARISIHTPLAGSDHRRRRTARRRRHFNPHSPCGERPDAAYIQIMLMIFQSTLPLRGATTRNIDGLDEFLFQSTLPLRGATEWRA